MLRNMTRNQPRFQLTGIHSNHPVSLQVYSWNKKGRSEIVTVAEAVRINANLGSRSTGDQYKYRVSPNKHPTLVVAIFINHAI